MSSIRPLATITVLVLVGVFLYMKINETEPVLPAEVEGFEIEEMQIGGDFSAPSVEEQYDAVAAEGGAPEFQPSTPSGGAPTFEPGTAAAPPVPPAVTDSPVEAPSFSEAPAADSATIGAAAPELPPIPPVAPPTSSTPPGATVGSTGSSSTSPSAPPSLNSPPTASSPVTPQPEGVAQESQFATTRLAAEAALDRGELSQALLLLSDWYGDPSLAPPEAQAVDEILGQLAGSVIYSQEHRLEPPYMVQAGEKLEDIAKRYNIPWQLLAKINGLGNADQLQPGQELKVVRGPFSALIDLSQRRVTMMLDRRYAGRFPIEVEPTTTVEEGQWAVNQKLLTPGNVGPQGAPAATSSDQRSLMLATVTGGTNQMAILRGPASATVGAEPSGRVIRLKSEDIADLYDILSLGSKVTIRR